MPSPSASASFTVSVPPEKVWAIVSDLPKLGSLIKEVTKVNKIDDRNAEWELTMKVGFVTQKIKMHSFMTELDPPRHAAFKAESDEADLMGAVDMTPMAGGGTSVSFNIQGKGKGPLGRIIDGILSDRLLKEINEVIEKLQRMIQERAVGEAP